MSRTDVRGSGAKLVVALFLLASMLASASRDAEAQTTGDAYICNDRISVHILADGRLTFGAFPNPSTCRPRLDGKTRALSGGWPDTPSSFTTAVVGSDPTPLHELTMTNPPTNFDADTNVTEWIFGDIAIKQTVDLVQNPLTGLVDSAQISYDMLNPQRKVPRSLGIRFMLDTKIGNNTNVPLYVEGAEVTAETDYPATVLEQYLVGAPDNPARAGGILFGSGNTLPDRFVIGSLPKFFADDFNYSATGEPMPFDTAVGAFWLRSVDSGAAVTYITQYGLAAATPTPSPDTCTAGPRTVCGTNGDDFLTARDGSVFGGPGDDTLELTVDSDTQSLLGDCGSGNDTLILHIEDLTSTVDVNLICGDGNDTVIVPRQPGELQPVVRLGDGQDVLESVSPDATPRLAGLLQGGFTGRYRIFAGLGRDRVTAGLGRDSIDGEGGNDRLGGAGGADDIEGGGGDDNMLGGDGADVLHGGDGANNFAGGPGLDTCLSDTRVDRFNGCERIRRNHRRNHLPL